MRKMLVLLLMFVLSSAASAQEAGVKWLHNKENYSDSIAVAVVPGRAFIGEFQPPAVYNKWWAEVMKCSRLYAPKKDRDSVRFYWVYGDFGFLVEGGGPLFAGWTSIWTRQIYLMEGRLLDRKLVEHEMLHFLLWETATPIGLDGHPSLYYKTRCHLN